MPRTIFLLSLISQRFFSFHFASKGVESQHYFGNSQVEMPGPCGMVSFTGSLRKGFLREIRTQSMRAWKAVIL